MAKPKAKTLDPLDFIRTRIREAEKKQTPVIREAIGMSSESFETVAELVERGLGKKPDVLRQALATGLRVLKAGSDEHTTTISVDSPTMDWLAPTETHESEVEKPALSGLVAGALGMSLPISAPTETPPTHDVTDEEEAP